MWRSHWPGSDQAMTSNVVSSGHGGHTWGSAAKGFRMSSRACWAGPNNTVHLTLSGIRRASRKDPTQIAKQIGVPLFNKMLCAERGACILGGISLGASEA